jgi:hypothetical protein
VTDQPGAGYSNDLWPRSRNPCCPTGFVTVWQSVRAQLQLVGFAPSVEAARRRFGVDACLPQPSGGSLADIAAIPTIDNYVSARKAMRPIRCGLGVHSARGRQQAPLSVASVTIDWTNVNQRRCAGQANDT